MEQNELISKKQENFCKALNYIWYFLTLGSTITGCISSFTFASLIDIPIGITSSAIELKICPIAAGIKKYKSIIMKNKYKRDKLVLLAKSKSSRTEVLILKL